MVYISRATVMSMQEPLRSTEYVARWIGKPALRHVSLTCDLFGKPAFMGTKQCY
jgi:hypothetical protein